MKRSKEPDMKLEDEYSIRGKIIGVCVHAESAIDDILTNAVSKNQVAQYRINSYFLRYLGLRVKLNLTKRLLKSQGLFEKHKSVFTEFEKLVDLRNILAHNQSILNETDQKIGFFELDQKEDNLINVIHAKNRDEWQVEFNEAKKIVYNLIDASEEIIRHFNQ